MSVSRLAAVTTLVATLAACASEPPPPPADLVLVNAKVYSMSWADPATDGTPATGAPHDASGWRPDAAAVAITGGRITLVGTREAVEARKGPQTQMVDLGGATLLPGLVDSHSHILELGAKLSAVDLVGVTSEAEAVDRVAAYAAKVPKGELGASADHRSTRSRQSGGAIARRCATTWARSSRAPRTACRLPSRMYDCTT